MTADPLSPHPQPTSRTSRRSSSGTSGRVPTSRPRCWRPSGVPASTRWSATAVPASIRSSQPAGAGARPQRARGDRRAAGAGRPQHRPHPDDRPRGTTAPTRRASSCATCSRTPPGTPRTRRTRPRSARAGSRPCSTSRRSSPTSPGLATANASMLDEATAAAEAMTLLRRAGKSASNVFVVDADAHPRRSPSCRPARSRSASRCVVADLSVRAARRRTSTACSRSTRARREWCATWRRSPRGQGPRGRLRRGRRPARADDPHLAR